jgi:hypothetical protein
MRQTSLGATTRPVATPRITPYARSAPRLLAAVVLPIGPAAVAVLRYLLPYDTTDSGSAIVRQIAAHQGRENLVVWLGFVAVLTLVPGVLWVGRITARSAPRLTAAALLLLVPAYLSLAFLVSSDAIALYGVRHGLAVSTVADMYDGVHPIVLVAGVLFVVGHVFGTILLGTAMCLGGAVPLWAGVATVLAQPLHFVAAIIVSSHALDLVGWGLNALGFAAVSAVMLRMADDDRPPLSAGREGGA